ncbi:PP2C family protein-serine/threonine phosphatase [Streptomyces regalis]|uniref:PP2C family protein-serine/threonine phosphatase n=1 Tax=Streptomyces regalis TaxID=68262 RepID=UPI000AC55CA0
MLQDPDLSRHDDNIAVRYLPATQSLNVCGDWYDVADLPPDRYAVAGDVVGHGLRAAAVMGMFRNALSAAIRAIPSPAQALEVLGLYARLIIYSNAGQPAPGPAPPPAPRTAPSPPTNSRTPCWPASASPSERRTASPWSSSACNPVHAVADASHPAPPYWPRRAR